MWLKLIQGLVEIKQAGLPESVHGVGSLLAQEDLIDVGFQDFLLAVM